MFIIGIVMLGIFCLAKRKSADFKNLPEIAQKLLLEEYIIPKYI
jgi:hypothetical protein